MCGVSFVNESDVVMVSKSLRYKQNNTLQIVLLHENNAFPRVAPCTPPPITDLLFV